MAAQTIWEGMVRGKPSRLLSEAGTITIEPLTEGVLSNIASGLWGFAKAHPMLIGFGGAAMIDSIKKYKEARDKSVKFYAKDKEQKDNMQAVIDQMTKSGYKVVKQLNKGSAGYEWELTRK